MSTRSERLERHQRALEARERVKSGQYNQQQEPETYQSTRSKALETFISNEPIMPDIMHPENAIREFNQRETPMIPLETNPIKRSENQRKPFEPIKTAPGMIDVPQLQYETNTKPLPGLDLPVVGPVLRGLDAVQKFTEPAAKVAEQLYTPGAGLSAVGGFTRGVGSLLSKVSPKIGNGAGLGAKVAREAIKEGVTGVPLGVGQSLASNPEGGLKEAAKQGVIGGVLGAAGGAAAPLIGKGLKAIEGMKLPTQASRNMGISAFAKEAGPYNNLKTDTKSQLVSKLTREKPSMKGASDRFYTAVVDDVHSFNQFDKLTEKVLGRELKPSERTHQLALGTRGADVVSNQILTHGLVDQSGEVVGKSLKESLSAIPKGKFVDFEDYLVNKHAITRAERDEQVFRDDLGWTPEKGAAKVSQYEAQHPEFVKAAEDVKNFQNTMLQKWLVDTGIITPGQAEAYVKANPNYVPMKRYFTDLEKSIKPRAKKGFANQSDPSKPYSPTGSQRKIISPVESMIENVDMFVKAAKRNQVMQAFVKNIKQAPGEFRDYAEIVEQPLKLDNIKGIDLTNPDALDEVLSRMNEDFDRVMQKTRLDKDNIVRVLINGEPVHVKINDKQLLDAVTALGPENGSKLLDAVGWLTNKMKVLTTGANPMFSLTRNILRDIPQAYISSKTTGNPLRFAADLFDASWSILRNKPLYQEFKNMGGGHASSVAADRNLLRQSKRDVLPAKKNPLQGALPKAYSKMENFLNAVESAPRLGEYKRLTAGGTADDRLQGLFEANDVTVNFKRRGRLTRELDKVFPYFNAAVQGLDKFARIYKDNPAKALAKSFIAVTLPTMAAYAWNYDNPDYQKVSNHIKDNFILIPKGDGTFFKIAKPKEIGTAWSDIPERLMRMFHQQDPKAFADFASQLRSTFTIPGVQGALKSGGITQRLSGVLGDTIVGPVADIQANQDYADRPIVPGYLANLSPELQADARTSSLSKKIGGLTGTSPKELDYLIRQYTGVLGQVGLPMMAPGSGNPGQALGNSIKQQVTADPVFSNDTMNEFYEIKSKYDQAKRDSSVTGDLPKWYNDDIRKYLGRVNTGISGIRKQMRVIESDQSIPANTKRQQLRMMTDQMNKLVEEANLRVAGVAK